jgi:hypothetical protein
MDNVVNEKVRMEKRVKMTLNGRKIFWCHERWEVRCSIELGNNYKILKKIP